LGTDLFNPIANSTFPLVLHRRDINAQMAALELSLDKDWIRYRVSAFYSSGASRPTSNTERGFDSIMDNPNFAGGFFSFWVREGIRLLSTGVGLTEGNSLIPSLQSSKSEGQANFVNPGIFIYNHPKGPRRLEPESGSVRSYGAHRVPVAAVRNF
jgi:hypothetical protein